MFLSFSRTGFGPSLSVGLSVKCENAVTLAGFMSMVFLDEHIRMMMYVAIC